jgi:aspartate/methionine/tyrosine aminotransferase
MNKSQKIYIALYDSQYMVSESSESSELNDIIKRSNSSVYDMLSSRGKLIFFPKKGILAQTADAKDKEINATIGIALEEDLTPMRLKPISKLIKKLKPEDVFSYASSFGKPELREKWKQLIIEKNPSIKSEISLPVITNALTHGLSIAGYLFVSPKDDILIPNLFWENYELIFSNTYGANLVKFPLFFDNEFDIEGFKNSIKTQGVGKKIILLNFPNNPTGYTPKNEEIDEIIDSIKESAEKGNKIVVIIDDAYFGLVYENNIFKESIFAKLADLHENVLAIKLDAATKEDYVWGLRVGFITFGIKNGAKEIYAALENKTAGVVRATISNASNLSQSLVLKGIEHRKYQKEKQKKYSLLKERYNILKQSLSDPRYKEVFTPLPFNSGYFMCIELNEGFDAEQVRKILLEKYSTGIIVFGKRIIRIAFSSLKKKQIPVLLRNIYEACSEIRKA